MTIKYNGRNLIKRIIDGREVEKVMYNGVQIRPDYIPPTPDYLCFTANTAGSTVRFDGDSSYMLAPASVEYSYDKKTWNDYQYGNYLVGETITLQNIGDKVYFRNKSETPMALATYYYCHNFYLTGSISASGDVGFMLCKYSTNVIPDYGCRRLFSGNGGLTTAPRLPATQVGAYGYAEMFNLCLGLTTTPELPATTLSYYCYFKMFSYCTSLTTVSTLPALTLAGGCYYEMFRGCTSIISLPELPATNLPVACYMGMFNECTSIKLSDTPGGDYQIPYIIPAGGGGTDDTNSLYNMFANTGGTFTGTPIINTEYYLSTDNEIVGDFDYLCFTANTAGSTIKFSGDSSYSIAAPSLQYSYDKTTWIDYQYESYAQGETITLNNIGDKVYFRNISKTPTALCTYYHTQNFVLTGSISASGDVGFMLCRYSTNVIPDYGLKYLFSNCTALTTAPKLPATTLGSYCYEAMFSLTSITVAPELPATTLAYQCYVKMFEGCSSLVTPPELPATTLTMGCYRFMFMGCSSLVTAPSLPAMTLGEESYKSMFYGCANLETLPALPATIIPNECYYEMFAYCSKIKLSTQQTGEYVTPYMIPSNGGGTTTGGSNFYRMFRYTGGDVTGTPSINTQYYTSNTII